MGMISTSFFLLLSSLFIINRQTVHLSLHLGSFAGMLLIPPITEFVILSNDWQSALYLPLGSSLLCLIVLVLSLLIIIIYK